MRCNLHRNKKGEKNPEVRQKCLPNA